MTFQVSKRLLTVSDYHKMAEVGILPDRGIELINGEIIEMSPIGGKHITIINRLNKLLTLALGDNAIVSVQNPIITNENSEPEPDIAILKYRADFYGGKTPRATDSLLIIEIADSTLAYDRDIKSVLYAESGVPEFWLIDLKEQSIEAYWEPVGKAYKYRALLYPGDVAEAQYFDLKLPVAEVMP
ncbi:MAG: Uma2 family endonuclease [Saprospiraceae bacterium]|nr:Uma2 family endonuclease [Saprospiraceae bacterium]